MDAVVGTAGILLLVIVIVYLIRERPREKIGNWVADKNYRIWFLPAAILIYYTILTLCAGQWNLDLFLSLALYFCFPTVVLYLTCQRDGKATLADFLVVISLWLPIEINWVQTHWLTVKIAGNNISYPLSVYTAIVYVLIAFTSFRRLDLNCRLSIKSSDWKLIAWVFMIIATLIIPIALGIGFLKPGLSKFITHYYWGLPLVFLGIFLAPAFGEELMFRGIIQNLIRTRFGPILTLLLASLIFGFVHINNKVGHFQMPNYYYVCFATIAGLGYGYVYMRSKSLVASALLHAFVDFVWLLFFRGG